MATNAQVIADSGSNIVGTIVAAATLITAASVTGAYILSRVKAHTARSTRSYAETIHHAHTELTNVDTFFNTRKRHHSSKD